MQHIFGLSGQEEMLALEICKRDSFSDKKEKEAERTLEMGDDALFEKDDTYDEQADLESMAYDTYGDLS